MRSPQWGTLLLKQNLKFQIKKLSKAWRNALTAKAINMQPKTLTNRLRRADTASANQIVTVIFCLFLPALQQQLRP